MPNLDQSIQVWVVPLIGQTAKAWRPVLADAEWQKAMRYRYPEDQIRSAVTRGVMRILLGQYLSVSATEIAFVQNAHGKPALAGNEIEFNASHSGDYTLIAFCRQSPIGVDVEQIKGKRVVGDLAARVLSPAEYQRFSSLTEPDQKQTFFKIWTLKESVLKGIGSGLSVAPEKIEISFYPETPMLLSADTEYIADVTDWSLQSVEIGDDRYAAAIAVQQKAPVVEIKRFESRSLGSI